jgi:hypothetical protein
MMQYQRICLFSSNASSVRLVGETIFEAAHEPQINPFNVPGVKVTKSLHSSALACDVSVIEENEPESDTLTTKLNDQSY